MTSLWQIQQGFDDISSKVEFHPSKGYSWSTLNTTTAPHQSRTPQPALASAQQIALSSDFHKRMYAKIEELARSDTSSQAQQQQPAVKTQLSQLEQIKMKLLKDREDQARAEEEKLRQQKEKEAIEAKMKAQQSTPGNVVQKRKKKLNAMTPGTPGTPGSPAGSVRKTKKHSAMT